MNVNVASLVDRFRRSLALTTNLDAGGFGWKAAITGAAPPTLATVNGGGLKFTLTGATQIQILSLYANDLLAFPIRGLQHLWYVAEVGSLGANTSVNFGLGSARNDAITSVTRRLFAGVINSGSADNNVVVNSADGVVTNTDFAAGFTLPEDTPVKFHFDFTGGLPAVQVRVNDQLVDNKFDMSNVAASQSIQPIVQLQKTAVADAPTCRLIEAGVNFCYDV